MCLGLFCCFVINPLESDPGLESDLAAQAANIEAIENAIAALAASYATGAATADETAAEVTALTAALAAAQADIATILQNNNVLSANLVINDAATLAYATALGDKVSIINGNVTITQGSLDTAALSAVTSKIATVVGTVSVTAAAALDFSTLTAVSGNYEVAGFDVEDDALTSAANVTLSYAGGYTQPNLTTAGAIDLNTTSYTSTATGTLEIDFSGLTSATSITNNGVGANDLTAAVATNVNLGAVAIASLTAPKALTVTLGKTAATAVTISTASATAVVVGGTTALSGNLAITATGNVTLSALKTVGGTTTITTAGELNAPALTTLTGVSAITASAVNTDALKTLTGAATVSKASVLNLPALTTVSGGLTAANLITLNTPVLAATSTITTASATTYIMKSVDAIGRFASLATLESITLSAQTADLDFGTAAKLATLNVVGTANTTDITIGNAPKLAAVSLSGKLGTTTVEGALASLTTGLTTAGTVQSLTISGTTKLTGANLGHTEDAANGAQLTVVNNALLASLSTNINRVTKFVVTGNAKLASIDASSMVSMPVNSTSSTAYTFDISGNSNAATTFATETGLKGAFTAAAAATATTAATDAIYKQNSLLTVKPYLTTVMTAALATSATATGTVNLDYVILSGTTATATKLITTGYFSAANKAEVAKVAAE